MHDFGSRPVHPALVTLPIDLLTSAVVADRVGRDRRTARTLIGAGLVTAVPAVWTGYSDWNDTQGAKRRVGLVHIIANAAGPSLLGLSWVARGRGSSGSALAVAGLTALGGAGWLGGRLAYALGVGVDTTAFPRPPTKWTDACALDALTAGVPVVAHVQDVSVLVVGAATTFTPSPTGVRAAAHPCHEGKVIDGCGTCSWHDSIFSLDDGAVVRGPATRPAPTFETRIVSGRVHVRRDEVRSLRLNPTS